jgi:hypothetical protein
MTNRKRLFLDLIVLFQRALPIVVDAIEIKPKLEALSDEDNEWLIEKVIKSPEYLALPKELRDAIDLEHE